MFIVAALLVAIIIIMAIWIRKKKAKKITASYIEASGNAFRIKGDESTFIISKNKQYDFIVKQGRIIASRDRAKSKKFVYYEGE